MRIKCRLTGVNCVLESIYKLYYLTLVLSKNSKNKACQKHASSSKAELVFWCFARKDDSTFSPPPRKAELTFSFGTIIQFSFFHFNATISITSIHQPFPNHIHAPIQWYKSHKTNTSNNIILNLVLFLITYWIMLCANKIFLTQKELLQLTRTISLACHQVYHYIYSIINGMSSFCLANILILSLWICNHSLNFTHFYFFLFFKYKLILSLRIKNCYFTETNRNTY